MDKRHMALLSAIACWAIVCAPVIGAEAATAPTKTIVRTQDGLRVVCESRGQGETALLFVHGWCGSREYWKHQADEFAADYRVVTLDQAGHGESGKDRRDWNIGGLAKDVESVVKALGLKRVIVIGHSMGGPVGLVAAKRMPGTVIAVIGVDTLQNAEVKMAEETRKQLTAGLETDFKSTVQSIFSGILPAGSDPELRQWLTSKAQAQDQAVALALFRDLSVLDTKVLLKEAGVPVRCINSGGGYEFFLPTAAETNRKYADYDAIIISDVGHYPMLEKPAEFNRKLRGVLAEFAPKQ